MYLYILPQNTYPPITDCRARAAAPLQYNYYTVADGDAPTRPGRLLSEARRRRRVISADNTYRYTVYGINQPTAARPRQLVYTIIIHTYILLYITLYRCDRTRQDYNIIDRSPDTILYTNCTQLYIIYYKGTAAARVCKRSLLVRDHGMRVF